MSSNNVAEFVNVTQASPETAQEYLAKSGDDLELAVSLFLSSHENAAPAAASASSAVSSRGATPPGRSLSGSRKSSAASSSSALHRAPRHRFSTFSDLAREQFVTDGIPGPLTAGDDPAQFFTGGEKSGLAVTNPNDGNNNNPNSSSSTSPSNLVDQIIKKAQQRGAAQPEDGEDSASEPAAFLGRGFRLGGDYQSSANQVAIESSDEEDEEDEWGSQPVLRRTLYFWRDGFSIDEGPLYRFDDPRNEVYLRAINMGRAPVELLKVKPHQAVDVRIEQRPTEEYVKPRSAPSLDNAGPGQRLGSVPPAPASPGVATSGAASAPRSAAPASAPQGLGSQGDATVQLRLADGSVHRLRFESSGPVQQLYDFVDATGTNGGRSYVLQMPMPPTKLEDRAASLKNAGAVGAVVVQRWA